MRLKEKLQDHQQRMKDINSFWTQVMQPLYGFFSTLDLLSYLQTRCPFSYNAKILPTINVCPCVNVLSVFVSLTLRHFSLNIRSFLFRFSQSLTKIQRPVYSTINETNSTVYKRWTSAAISAVPNFIREEKNYASLDFRARVSNQKLLN